MDFDALNPTLKPEVEKSWHGLSQSNPDLAQVLESQAHLRESLPRVWGASAFVRRVCCVNGDALDGVVDSIRPDVTSLGYGSLLTKAIENLSNQSETEQMAALRRFRRNYLMSIAWRDVAGWLTVEQVLAEVSALADALIQAAVDLAVNHFKDPFGRARSEDNTLQELVVLGMGKLGGGELNFSSDVDLVFLFPEAGETDGARSISNERYFQRVCQQILKLLDQITADGFVWRVDIRLRPFGTVGPLAMSFSAFESYLEIHGREWERYAYIKARPLTGNKEDRARILSLLSPFVYRRYLDYGVFESIRGMKHSIIQEMKSRRTANNIKLGEGGIREIEFIAQTFQLIRGGTNQRLQQRALLATLDELCQAGMISRTQLVDLTRSYLFLRRYENHLQQYNDQQTHDVPVDRTAQEALACAMNEEWDVLSHALDEHRSRVSGHFSDLVIGPSDTETDSRASDEGADGDLQLLVQEYKEGAQYRRLDKHGQRRIDALLPVVVATVQKMDEPDTAMQRIMAVFQAIGRRSSYFSLLLENRQVLERLIDLCSRSIFLTNTISEHPILLDELIDHDSPFLNLTTQDFRSSLEQRLTDEAPGDSLEYLMDALRHFQHASLFAIALRDLDGASIAKVSDQLTFLAESVVEKVLNAAWDQAVEISGIPKTQGDEGLRDTQFAVIAYGKLGGYELGYKSDLDLVFLHDSGDVNDQTTGPKVMDNGRFFARMVQRMMHFLQTPTAAGILYQVDTRLRPSGRSGLLVSTLDAFENYQASEAWTWEHQALLRARFVAGHKSLGERFETVRRGILCQPRDHEDLVKDVLDMRSKMRQESPTSAGFHLKQDVGGMTDIEFIVQFLVLQWANQYPALVEYTDNLRLLEGLAAAGVIDQAQQQELAEVYLNLRQRLHRRNLDGKGSVVPEREFARERRFVQKVWGNLLGVRV
ncbi:MAG: bifunctional [glutamate--ammonia ligase]-adenylyl-L-tyrosine phosphorylase/[glutamate--ammonia-ligase] adenylyltransferase [Pseudomonadota bacterium]